MDYSPPGSCPWDSPGKTTGVGAFPPSGDLPDPGVEPASLVSPALQVGSLPLVPPGCLATAPVF